jgi:hypothetical protein
MIEVENQWEDLMRDIQNTYKHYDRPLDYELK